MKNLIKFLVLLMVPVFLLTSCKDDPVEPDVTDFETLTQYMYSNDLDLPSLLDGWVKPVTSLGVDETDYSVPGYFVLDIRSETDFNAGHIKGAVNTPLTNILEAAEDANGTPILVVCYTGQTAARATAALRLMNFEAYSLKWGMSSWHSDMAGKWNANATDYASPNWLTSGAPVANVEFTSPKFSTGETGGAAILENRVRAMLSMQWTVTKTDVLDAPGNYFLNNYWPIESWEEYGHIDGAYRINEELGLEGLKYLDPDATIVTYCYTGQTSGIVTGWLDVLGYNGRSLMFGANGIVHTNLLGSAVGGGHKKAWGGEGSASDGNFGYYDESGTMHDPN